jgi:hypothetical protein
MNLKDISKYSNLLLLDSALGWSDCPTHLARTLGFYSRSVLVSRVNGQKRMTLGEQQRASDGLGRILRGEIICERRLFRGKLVGDVREVEVPKPLFELPGHQCTVKVTQQGVKLAVLPPKRVEKQRGLPTFRSLV